MVVLFARLQPSSLGGTTMIEAFETDTGVIFLVKVQPNAKKNAIVGEYGNRLKVTVTAPPERGKANKAVIDLISKELKIKVSRISVVSGQTAKDKKVHIEGESLKCLRRLEIKNECI